MKLLLLSEFFPKSEKGEITGGIEARNFYLAKYFKGKITIFTSRSDKDGNGNIFQAKVQETGPSHEYSQKTSLFKRFLFAFSCVRLSSSDFDVVEGTNFITHFAAILIGKIRNIEVVLWYPDVWVGKWVKNLGIAGIFGEILERMVLFFGKGARFIAISESTKEKLIKNGISEKNIRVIPCGVDEEEIANVGVEHVQPLQKIYDLVVVNRLVSYKNTEKVIKALSIFGRDRSRPVPTTLIIGDGQEKENLKKIISESKLQNIITIISTVKSHTELLEKIASAKIFISASSVEGFNIAALEAASLGLPCLLSNISAHVEHEKNLGGCLIFKNETDLGEKIVNLMNDTEKYEEFSSRNRKNSVKYYWSNLASQTENFYVS